jgi:zinc protease
MIFKGSTNRPSGAIDAEMEKLGGEINARTTRDATDFSTVVPSSKWKDALALLAEALQSPSFREEDIQTEARVIADEMAVARTDPAKNGFSRIASIAYDASDASHLPLMGTEAVLHSVTSESLHAFHQLWYRPENMTVSLVGNVKLEEVRKFVSFLFRGVGHTVASTPEVTAYTPLARIVRANPVPENEQKGRELTTVLIAFRTPSVRNNDLLPVLDTLMPLLANGNSGRFVNRLVKQEGLALSVAADFIPSRNAGLILLTIVTRSKQAPLVEKDLIDEIKRLSEDTLTVEETDRAAATVLGQVAYIAQSVQGRTAWLADLDVASPLMDPTAYTKRVTMVKAEELNKMVGLYLTPLAYAIAIIGPPPPSEAPEDADTSSQNTIRSRRTLP